MKVCGLTGGIGMGKSTISQIISRRGIKVIDTDDLARSLVQVGEPALEEIQTAFGKSIISADGQLRRGELASLVFANSAARQKLEMILHPRIRQAWMSQMETWGKSGEVLAVVVIPLLFETQAERYFNKIICAACLPLTQQERLSARGWSPVQISQRMAAQLALEEKINRSDFVIWTEGRLESTDRQVQTVIARL